MQSLEEAISAALSGNTEPLADWINEVIPGACNIALVNSGSNASNEAPDTRDTAITETKADYENTENADETTDSEHEESIVEETTEQDTPAPTESPTTATATEDKQASDKTPAFKPEPAVAPSKSVKVDQEKIDRLMNLIGEMTVAKNALPFLAKRAEEQHGLRDLAREIKEQFAVVNRIAEEMQDSIMQIRMMPFSFISMRFPRLVRDISRRLNKDVQLVIEGEDTEADKNIIESLAEPLIHIVRNSLDHGIEAPDVRKQKGKPATGNLTIRASQEADRVMIRGELWVMRRTRI